MRPVSDGKIQKLAAAKIDLFRNFKVDLKDPGRDLSIGADFYG